MTPTVKLQYRQDTKLANRRRFPNDYITLHKASQMPGWPRPHLRSLVILTS